ncbi:MAG: hypothetical protein HY094_01555 [Candidatus Melainabacteria bacterium]|nr:hypothetical protein [Candidatus Melainabacteria bacterium]
MIRKFRSLFFVLIILSLFAFVNYGFLKPQPIFAEAYTQVQTWINNYGDPNFSDDKLKVLGDIQPGLGVIMQEIGRRFTAIYYAARAGNWDLASYELKELREAQEVGEITRPKRKEALVAFEESFLGGAENPSEGTLQDAINKKNFLAFNKSFKSAIGGCNGCHQSTGFSFIKYRLPVKSELPLQFFLNEEGK